MIEGGRLQAEVAHHFNVSQSVISRLRHRYNETGAVAERPRSGRPRSITPAEDRFLTISARREPFSTCRMLWERLINAADINISIETVRRRLGEVHLASRRPLRRVPLTPEHKRQRLQWGTEHVHWQEKWNAVLFSR
ncbi:hypothetical protein TcasGA2_TC010082 [Tribolium castaneum]|uniref:Transposase Tc1-like domain-containing protein n=1 Tax=Tribolium castaneum TaxID=7070 RepID=D6WS74_TRICA|nr:hypothetical protein TcasGA2_TC010082 [Tribolium castaneum]